MSSPLTGRLAPRQFTYQGLGSFGVAILVERRNSERIHLYSACYSFAQLCRRRWL